MALRRALLLGVLEPGGASRGGRGERGEEARRWVSASSKNGAASAWSSDEVGDFEEGAEEDAEVQGDEDSDRVLDADGESEEDEEEALDEAFA